MPNEIKYERDPKKMDQYDLIRLYKYENDGAYFEEDTLRFFGEEISEMELTPEFVTVIRDGKEYKAYELRVIRRRYALEKCEAFYVYTYFDSETLFVLANCRKKLRKE